MERGFGHGWGSSIKRENNLFEVREERSPAMRRPDHNGKKAGAISWLRHGYCRMGSKDETRLAILSVIHLCDGNGGANTVVIFCMEKEKIRVSDKEKKEKIKIKNLLTNKTI
ncbi:hypothetical protein [Angelakisella massiliensis]|uniref:hypothetical protein n=1 Tax=Angelakisella massiliensis TaxID=1871018 RepID=UPI001113A1CB|nr:hypothetical protein [Angelakisella massiliensis]